mmetsp:Transcript_22663/g.49055  ORF Transcript_22663/g.49055 Transcript_22663/m.49055 type:complete len:283 (-) Transcript_22663:1544-2392(-)
MRMRDERTSHPKVELVSSMKRFDTPLSTEGRTAGSVAALRRGEGLRSPSSLLSSCAASGDAFALPSIVCNALLITMRHKLKRLSVKSFSIPSKPSSSDVFSSSLPAMIISNILSRMPNPALSSKRASTSSSCPDPTATSLASQTISSLPLPSSTTRLATFAVSMPALRGSVSKTNDSIPSRRASKRSFRMRDAAMVRAFIALSKISPGSPLDLGELSSPSVLRPAMGMAASSAENEGERNDGLARPPEGDGLANDGRANMLGLPPPEGDGLAKPGRPSDARG